MIPIPSIDFIPKVLKDNSTIATVQFTDEIDNQLQNILYDILGMQTLFIPDEIPARYLPYLGYFLNAGLLDQDSEKTKRIKIYEAVAAHKIRGSWKYQIKPVLDSMTGFSAVLYLSYDSNDWIECGDGVVEIGNDWSIEGGDGIYYGLSEVGEGTEVEVPGNIYVDLHNEIYDPIFDTTGTIDTNTWERNVFGDGVWCAISSDGTNRIIRSISKGIYWYKISAPAVKSYRALAYGDGVWIACSSDVAGSVIKSIDNGEIWTTVSASGVNEISSIAYGNNVWIAVSPTSVNQIVRSTNNGATWSLSPAPEAGGWYSVAYGDNVWISCSFGWGAYGMMKSLDNGITWTCISDVSLSYNAIAYGNGVWIAVGSDSRNQVVISDDNGNSWTPIIPPVTGSWNDVKFGDGVWVAVSSGGASRSMRSVDNGETWESVTIPANEWTSLNYGDGVWIAISITGSNRMVWSYDNCKTWSTTPEDIISQCEIALQNDIIPAYMKVTLGYISDEIQETFTEYTTIG